MAAVGSMGVTITGIASTKGFAFAVKHYGTGKKHVNLGTTRVKNQGGRPLGLGRKHLGHGPNDGIELVAGLELETTLVGSIAEQNLAVANDFKHGRSPVWVEITT